MAVMAAKMALARLEMDIVANKAAVPTSLDPPPPLMATTYDMAAFRGFDSPDSVSVYGRDVVSFSLSCFFNGFSISIALRSSACSSTW
jgi:hypothetical protein